MKQDQLEAQHNNRFAKHRAGVATRLDRIEATIGDLPEIKATVLELRKDLRAALARKSMAPETRDHE
jgi:hypothetical protein